MRHLSLFTLSALALASGCIDYNVEGKTEVKNPLDDGDPPCIEVSPKTVTFEAIEVTIDPPQTAVVTVSNTCTGDLEIIGVDIENASNAFSLGKIGSILIPADQQTEFIVTFDPQTSQHYSTRVLIESNDPVDPISEVQLVGDGVAPIIQVTPDYYDFGAPYIGCQLDQPYNVANVGNADLIVDQFDMFTGSVDFDFDLNRSANGDLPFTIAPTESVDVFVNYLGLDNFADNAYLTVTSNDPFTPEVVVQAEGTGTKYGDNLDVFEQPLKAATDILFTLDRSGSMGDENANVLANFESFISVMTVLEAEYHIAVSVQDSGCILGSDVYIDNTFSASDAQDTFDTMADVNVTSSGYGANTERGYMLAEAALANVGPGDCNYGFYRDDAFLSLVHVSDEPEQSVNSWSYYVSLFQSLKADPDDVKINAVAGDYPAGCGGAAAGTGYYEGTVATGGLFLSICATDWSSHLEELASESVSVNDSFELTQRPVQQTIEVTVDGISTTTGWHYDPSTNYVVFETDYIPAGGSTVEVYYELLPDCER